MVMGQIEHVKANTQFPTVDDSKEKETDCI